MSDARLPPFDVADFREKHPHTFPSFTDEQLNAFWIQACMVHSVPSDGSELDWKEKELMYMLVCHIATLSERGSGAGVGAVNSASEDGVSVSFSGSPASERSWWFNQTPCGAMYWSMIQRRCRGGYYFAYHRP